MGIHLAVRTDLQQLNQQNTFPQEQSNALAEGSKSCLLFLEEPIVNNKGFVATIRGEQGCRGKGERIR